LEKLKTSEDPYHILASVNEFLNVVSLESARLDLIVPGLISGFENPLCFEDRNCQESFRIFVKVLNRGVSIPAFFAAIADAIVPFLNHPDFFNISARIIITGIKFNHELASVLVYESDLFAILCDSLQPNLDSGHAIGSVLKWCLKFCDDELVKRANPRIAGLMQTLMSVLDSTVMALGATSMLYYLRKSEIEPGSIFTRSFFEFLLNLPDDFDLSPSVLCLLNSIILIDLDFFAELIAELPIFEWILKGLAVKKLERFAMRILGNLAHHDGYCQYFGTHCFCEILFNLEPFDFGANDDFFIFVCRMACYDCVALAQVQDLPKVLERLVDNLRSEHSVFFWMAFFDAIGNLLGMETPIRDFLMSSGLGNVMMEISEDGNLHQEVRDHAAIVVKEFFQTEVPEPDVPC
jgi:hypothetical protein